MPDGSLLVVAQAWGRRFIAGGTMAAEGFIIAPDGTRAPAPEEMLWPFL